MEVNTLPKYDMSDNPTNCCPRFKTDGWDSQDLHFKDKLFVKTKSFLHIPLNMGSVFPKTFKSIEAAGAQNDDDIIVLSRVASNWSGEHFFSAAKEVPGQEMVHMSGDFMTKVFEGPYKNVSKWEKEMELFVTAQGKQMKKSCFFYTTCPKCAKHYGKNYLVAVAEVQ